MKNGNWYPLLSGSSGCPLVGTIGGGAQPAALIDSNGSQISIFAYPTTSSYNPVGGGDLFPTGTDHDPLGRSITYSSSNHTIQYKDSNGAQRTITLNIQSLTLSCTLATPGTGYPQPSGTANVITN